MLKTLAKLFPFIDYLYIFQTLEYNLLSFIKWSLTHPLARNLQKKHSLVLTNKALLLLALTLFWMVFFSITLAIILLNNIFWSIPVFILSQFVSPIYLLLSAITYLPLDMYLKNKVIQKAEKKLASLKNLRIIAITGSFGKTSTKEILYTLLWKKYRVVKTPKSYNTSLGVAQTVLEDLKNNTEIFIAEVGAYKRGEIKKITDFLHPKIGVITAVAPQHLERFGSLENIALAKFELGESLPKDGSLFLNHESPELMKLSSQAKGKIIYYGPDSKNYYASDIEVTADGTSFSLYTPKGKETMTIPLLGEHHVKNFVAATAVAQSLGMSLQEIKIRAARLLPTPHRLEIKKQGEFTIIDNTYNTNPQSAQSSLKLLSDYPGKQKIVITPGLVELGARSIEENQLFAKRCAEVSDLIIIVGENARQHLLAGLNDVKYPKQQVIRTKTLTEALNLLPTVAKSGATILLENDLPDQYF